MSDCIKFQAESIKSALALNSPTTKNDGIKVKTEQWHIVQRRAEEKLDPFFYCFLHVQFFFCFLMSFHLRGSKSKSEQFSVFSFSYSTCGCWCSLQLWPKLWNDEKKIVGFLLISLLLVACLFFRLDAKNFLPRIENNIIV